MAYYAQNGGQVFATPTPISNPVVYSTAPVVAYPQTYPVYQQHPPVLGKYAASFSRVSSAWLGALLVISGAASLIAAGLAFRYYAYYSELGTGLWCGAMFLSTGAVAIAASQHTTDSLEEYAIVANSMLIGGASLAFIFGSWIFIMGCIALRCSKTEVIPVQIQLSPQHGPCEGTPTQQILSGPVQYVHYPQQMMASNYQSTPVIALLANQTNERHEPRNTKNRKKSIFNSSTISLRIV